MNKEKKTKKKLISIKEAYDMIPSKYMSEVRQKLAYAKDIDVSNINRVINGKTPVSPADMKAFEEIFAYYGIDVYTGRQISLINIE